jgi:hypothetical protein
MGKPVHSLEEIHGKKPSYRQGENSTILERYSKHGVNQRLYVVEKASLVRRYVVFYP